MAPPRRATARAAALPARRPFPSLAGHLPSKRSLAVGIALVVVAVGAYVLARQTSMFALRDVKVAGGSPELQAQVREALGPELGRSLVAIRATEVEDRLAAVPGVLAVRPIVPSRTRCASSSCPSRRCSSCAAGRRAGSSPPAGASCARSRTRVWPLPRVWIPGGAAVEVNELLAPESGAPAAAALAPLAGVKFPAHVRTVRATEKELTLVLHSGVELRLGNTGDLRLKLAVARQLLLLQGPDPSADYIDVSVPERPVVGGGNPQVKVLTVRVEVEVSRVDKAGTRPYSPGNRTCGMTPSCTTA